VFGMSHTRQSADKSACSGHGVFWVEINSNVPGWDDRGASRKMNSMCYLVYVALFKNNCTTCGPRT
jgi:hypothetical protein